jgi:PAS domain S-box-containing protein
MKQAGVVALVNVPIRLPGGKAFGLLQVDSTEPREFGSEDTQFLRVYATILGPIIDRLRQVSELRSSQERFRLIVENAHDYAIFLTDPEDRITDWLSGAQTVFGWTAEEAVGQPASILFTPEDREIDRPRQEIDTARRKGTAPNVRWHLRKDGSRVFIDGKVTALRHLNGELIGFLKIGQDVTERRHWEASQQTMIEELQHRTRNLIALVSSIAQQTQRTSPDLETFGTRFSGRLSALSRVQGLLSQSELRPVTLGGLVRAELDALAGETMSGRIRVDGPPVGVRNRGAQVLAMVLHELATNARKYGALSGDEGTLAVTWRIERPQAGPGQLVIDWVEETDLRGKPREPAAGGGYGRELIEKALPYSLDAQTSFNLTDEGLRCRIALPLDAVTSVKNDTTAPDSDSDGPQRSHR